MSGLRDKIYQELKVAMKAKAKVRLEALRFVWSEIHNAEIDVKGELKDDQVIKLIQSEVKKRKEALEQIKQGGREELVEIEKIKLKVIEEFLPEQMGEGEISELVDQVISKLGSPPAGGFGQVMKKVMGKVKGQADGKLVNEIVRKKLS